MTDRKTILVAEDDELVREQLRLMLSDEYDILMTEDGAHALTQYMLHAGRIALVLTDCEMPLMNGIQLTVRLWRDDPELPVIMTTGGGERTEFEHLLQTRNFALMWKPFDSTRLKELIECLIEGALTPA